MTRRSRARTTVAATALYVVAIAHDVFAQSADELAKQTQNPVSSLISVPLQANWDVGIGAREAVGTTLNIQPVAPFSLTPTWNVILRVIMPLVSQPTDDGLRINGMSDTLATAFLSPAHLGKVISALILTVSKVTTLGKRPVHFVVGAGPLIASPKGGADWKLRVQANFLFPR